MTDVTTSSASSKTSRRGVIALTLFFAALWFLLCRHLSSEWSLNEQYNYGWFVPFFAGYLFWLRWEDRPDRNFEIRNAKCEISSGRRFLLPTFAFLLLALLAPIRLFEVANPDWRPLGWIHALAVVALTLALVYSLRCASWLRHFAFPIAFILVAVPWISAIEAIVVQGLMSTIASAAAETVSLFGVPAQVQGNLIRLPNGVVGVNEACSGVRSLQTSIMIGLLFGELKRLSGPRRFALLGSAVAIALLANFLRALFLVSVAARQNLEAVSRWHDIAGYAIVALVCIGTILLASALAKRESAAASQTAAALKSRDAKIEQRSSSSTFSFSACQRFSICAILWLFAVEIGVECWYRIHERQMQPANRWTINWPQQAPGFREVPIDEGVRATLRFDEGRQAVWTPLLTASAAKAPSERCFLFFFRWNPGGSSVVRARAHRPDICLPAAGWRQQGEGRVQRFQVNPELTLPFRQVDFVNANGATTAHTFFFLQEDRQTNETRRDLRLDEGTQPDWSLPARWQAVQNGVRNMGQQVMELVLVSTQPTSPESGAADVARILPGLIQPTR